MHARIHSMATWLLLLLALFNHKAFALTASEVLIYRSPGMNVALAVGITSGIVIIVVALVFWLTLKRKHVDRGQNQASAAAADESGSSHVVKLEEDGVYRPPPPSAPMEPPEEQDHSRPSAAARAPPPRLCAYDEIVEEEYQMAKR